MICANHASIFDILALVRVVPIPFRFVAKRELTKWPIIGWALRPSGQIVIDRKDRVGAIRAIAEAAMRKIRGQIIFFVEGTRSRTGELLPFKKGAFHFAIDHALPVLPTAICGSYAALARVPWWRQNPGRTIEVRFGVPLPVEHPAHESVESLMAATREQIAGELAASPFEGKQSSFEATGAATGTDTAATSLLSRRRVRGLLGRRSLPTIGDPCRARVLVDCCLLARLALRVSRKLLGEDPMDPKEIQRLIAAGLPGAEVEVVDEVGDGNHFRATIVAPQFAGKTLVQRHQMVYATLGDAMRDRIHALSIGAYTPEEWERRSGAAQPAATSAARD